MTDLKPFSKGGAPNLGTTSEANAAKFEPTPLAEPTPPTKTAQTNAAETTRSTRPAEGQPASSGAPCVQPDCHGTVADGYCNVCGSPAPPTLEPAASTPAKASTAETPAAIRPNPAKVRPDFAPCTQPDCPGTVADGYCDICGSPAVATLEQAASTPAKSSAAETPAAIRPNPAKVRPDFAPCTQPDCPGTVADGYCDICGSPAVPTLEPVPSTQPALYTSQTEAPTKSSLEVTLPAAPTTLPEPSAAEAAAAAFRAAQAAAAALSRSRPTISQPPATKPAEPSAAAAAAFTKPGTVKREPRTPIGDAHTRTAQAMGPNRPNAETAPPSLAEADSGKPARRRRVLPIVLASVASTLVAILAVAGLFINQLERSLTQNLDREDLMPTDANTAPHPTKEASAGDALNFVVMGYDSRSASVERTGSLMILHLNATRDQAYLITFPRDTWVSIPGHGNNKINAAYRFGGPKLTVSTVEQLTNTQIDHAVLVDFQGFARLTDAVGGVTVYNKTSFSSHGFDYPKGNITVSGERALYFVGEQNALARGDFDRAANERNLVMAIIAKSLSAKTLTDPRRLFTVVSGAAEHLTVDRGLTNTSIRSTIFSLRLSNKDVHVMKAPVSGKASRNGQSVAVVDKSKLGMLRTALREDRVDEYLAKYPQG